MGLVGASNRVSNTSYLLVEVEGSEMKFHTM